MVPKPIHIESDPGTHPSWRTSGTTSPGPRPSFPTKSQGWTRVSVTRTIPPCPFTPKSVLTEVLYHVVLTSTECPNEDSGVSPDQPPGRRSPPDRTEGGQRIHPFWRGSGTITPWLRRNPCPDEVSGVNPRDNDPNGYPQRGGSKDPSIPITILVYVCWDLDSGVPPPDEDPGVGLDVNCPDGDLTPGRNNFISRNKNSRWSQRVGGWT